MSCGSTDCTSTRYIKPVSPAFPDLGRFWQLPLSWLAQAAARRERRRRYAQILELDDRLLADIGISRSDAGEIALRSSGIDASRWHIYR